VGITASGWSAGSGLFTPRHGVDVAGEIYFLDILDSPEPTSRSAIHVVTTRNDVAPVIAEQGVLQTREYSFDRRRISHNSQ